MWITKRYGVLDLELSPDKVPIETIQLLGKRVSVCVWTAIHACGHSPCRDRLRDLHRRKKGRKEKKIENPESKRSLREAVSRWNSSIEHLEAEQTTI